MPKLSKGEVMKMENLEIPVDAIRDMEPVFQKPELRPITAEVFKGKEFQFTNRGNPDREQLKPAECVIGSVDDLEMMDGFEPTSYDLVIIALSPGFTNSETVIEQTKQFLYEAGILKGEVKKS